MGKNARRAAKGWYRMGNHGRNTAAAAAAAPAAVEPALATALVEDLLEEKRVLAHELDWPESVDRSKIERAAGDNLVRIQKQQAERQRAVSAFARSFINNAIQNVAEREVFKQTEATNRATVAQQQLLERHALLEKAAEARYRILNTASKPARSAAVQAVGTPQDATVKGYQREIPVRTNLFSGVIPTQTDVTTTLLEEKEAAKRSALERQATNEFSALHRLFNQQTPKPAAAAAAKPASPADVNRQPTSPTRLWQRVPSPERQAPATAKPAEASRFWQMLGYK